MFYWHSCFFDALQLLLPRGVWGKLFCRKEFLFDQNHSCFQKKNHILVMLTLVHSSETGFWQYFLKIFTSQYKMLSNKILVDLKKKKSLRCLAIRYYYLQSVQKSLMIVFRAYKFCQGYHSYYLMSHCELEDYGLTQQISTILYVFGLY